MQYLEYLFGFSFKLFTYAFYIPHNFVYLYHIFNKLCTCLSLNMLHEKLTRN